MPFGAQVEAGGVRFRLWAPDAAAVALRIDGQADRPMPVAADGWAELLVPGLGAGARYGFVVGDLVVPDPASRHQPDGVHRLSAVVDPGAYDWQDGAWRGRDWSEAVVYELHVGTFTPEGTFRAVLSRLDYLAELGVTAIELMPVADFPGRRGWGYDGVLPYAPHGAYGRPEDLKALIDAAHARGLMMLLDVVYNHFGPEGNYLHATARRFFTDRHHTPWGQAVNYDGADARPVREFVIHNALYWLEEFHFDGLRLDAVHAIVDESRPGLLDELAVRVRARFPDRPVHLVVENDRNESRLLARGEAGAPVLYTAQWNDDIHHAWHRMLTGEAGGYYRDYAPDPLDHLGRCLAEGFAYQGEASEHRGGAPRGQPTAGLPPGAFVAFLQNHDQIGNRALGERLDALAPAAAVEAALAVLLLSPQPPLLFMGEEWGAATPFLFFCDLGPDLAQAVRRGRRHEFAGFPQFHGAGARRIPDPLATRTAARSRLDWREAGRSPHAGRLALVRHLLALRRREVAPRLAGAAGGRVRRVGERGLDCAWRLGDGAVLTVRANLGDRPQDWDGPAAGRRLYGSTAAGAPLPAWGVDWHLAVWNNEGGNGT